MASGWAALHRSRDVGEQGPPIQVATVSLGTEHPSSGGGPIPVGDIPGQAGERTVPSEVLVLVPELDVA